VTVVEEGFVLGPGDGRAPALGRIDIIFKVTGERAAGAYTFSEQTLAPGAGPTAHLHQRHEELFYIVEGEFEFRLGDELLRVGPGSVVFVPPGVSNGFTNPGTAPDRLVTTIAPPDFEHYFEELAAIRAAGGPPDVVTAAVTQLRLKYDTEEVPELGVTS
jgi:mannose-6-phosphate isomerase-like protein (cupin superfamily)